ncbi:TfuA-like protein [Rhizobium sp. SAFR-030]|uniref:TfuA-like protein n=1 Tax=Rhizobium sp. SAFR-030 TaxID=3387277 RepID=UPI003F805360
MKVVFVGPSLPDAAAVAGGSVDIRPPARQGDVMRALEDGASAIGLIDGFFEMVAPVWHKELLFALSQGVPVLGAASMGALRAAECEAFGMLGIGRIFDDYAFGARVDDADVALLHGPAELCYPSLTVPIVNLDATLENAVRLDILDPSQAARLAEAGRSLFYKNRTWKSMASVAGVDGTWLRAIVSDAFVDQKRSDACLLLDKLVHIDGAVQSKREWTFHATPLWRRLYPVLPSN